MHSALETTAERSACEVRWTSMIHSRYCLLHRAKRDFPSNTYRKNTHARMNTPVVRSDLCHAYGLHSKLLRSAILVLSIHMHTTSSLELRTLANLHQSQHTVVYTWYLGTVFEGCFNRVFFRSYDNLWGMPHRL